MSRIHEALRKAQEDRASDNPPHTIAPRAEMISQPQQVTNTASGPPTTLADNTHGVGQPSPLLTFDELRAHCVQSNWRPDPNVNVFFNPALSSHGAEQFRTLRSRLYQLRSGQQLRTLLITSSVPGEGKTFAVANLAQAIVRQPDRRALIIDADLRCARLHSMLGASLAPGLTDYLRAEVSELAVIQHAHDGNLCFIPGGNEVTNPSELISNGRLRTLLERVAPVFDWIIVDSPPCLPVADATILADLCDGVLLVVRAGSTPTATVQRARQELQGKNVVGVVLNAVQQSHLYGSYYYYQAYERASTRS